MKVSRAQSQFVHRYFREILGYGNKCPKCKKQGSVRNVTDSLVEFFCHSCKKGWGFDHKLESAEKLIVIGMSK